jgi:exodeoxyribonuclease V alpha subunit
MSAPADVFAARRARHAPGLLRAFNDAGVLAAADVHVALRLGALAGEADEPVLLAAALAVRGPRLGHTRVDLAEIARTAAVDAEEAVDVAALPWPDLEPWLSALRASPLVADGDGDGADGARPLRLDGAALYLDRYWREERRVAGDLLALAGPADGVDETVLAAGLRRVHPGATERQRLAAERAVRRRLAVVAGGPGTGKTTTVAQIVALLAEQAAGGPAPLVALAAPTNRAANRLQHAVHRAADELVLEEPVRELLRGLRASTLHRLLGRRPDSDSRFRHDRRNRLPHDVVIVDETSMVSLSQMARLIEAVRPAARLVLVGDPGQLTSVEAGVVLGDVVGPAADPAAAPGGAPVAEGIVVLDRVHRHGAEIGELAQAIRRGDAAGTLARLEASPEHVTWLRGDVAEPGGDLGPVRAAVVGAAREVRGAARAGDGRRALEALDGFRLLCAHRRGPHGVSHWTERIEQWLAEDLGALALDGPWYPGRPLLVTENDHALRLYNGDVGVVVATGAGDVAAAFLRDGEVATFRPGRLAAYETAYAMTVHKSQGSQFGTTAVLLPPPGSPLLTRELLYTAVTRARDRVLVAGTEEAITTAVRRPVARASGLRERLWGV